MTQLTTRTDCSGSRPLSRDLLATETNDEIEAKSSRENKQSTRVVLP